jgi:hypothetical protein
LKNLLAELKKIPAWGWAVAAAGVALALVFFRRPTAPAVTEVPVFEPDPGPPSNGQPAGQPRQPSIEDWQWNALSGLVADTRQQLATQGAWLERLSTSLLALTTNNGRTTTTAGPISSVSPSSVSTGQSPTTAPSISTKPTLVSRTVDRWVDDDKHAGYVQQTVSWRADDPNADLLTGIADAKDKFRRAEQAGDSAGMAAAHSQAERIRKIAKTEGVELPSWAR